MFAGAQIQNPKISGAVGLGFLLVWFLVFLLFGFFNQSILQRFSREVSGLP